MARQAKDYVETNPVVDVPLEAVQRGHQITLANEAALHEIKGALTADQIAFSERIGARRGRLRFAEAVQKLVTVTDLMELQRIKESKEYKGLQAISEDGKPVTVTTWEEYCLTVEGRSREQVDRDLLNLRTFGTEFMEAVQRLGVGYRELRDMRQLPEDERTALLEVAKSGDKDGLLDIAESLIAKHAKEKAELKGQVESLETLVQAKQEAVNEKNTEIDGLREAQRLKPVTAPWDEKIKAFKAEIGAHFDLMDESVGRLYLCHDAILQGDFGTAGDEAQEQKILRSLAVLYGDRLTRLVQQVAELQSHYDVTLSGWAGELDERALDIRAAGGAEG